MDGWDLGICFTRGNIAMKEGSTWYDYYRALAWMPSICHAELKYRVGISEANGDGVDLQVAHAILHSLDASNDKDTNCKPTAPFVMKEHMSKVSPHPGYWGLNWYMTECTVDQLCAYIKGLNTGNKLCLKTHGGFNLASWAIWDDTPLIGGEHSADEQCQDKWGNDSVQCDPTGGDDLFPPFMCSRYMWCTREGACVCTVRVLSGTPCGKAKICFKSECIPKPDVPLGDPCDCNSQCAGNHTGCDPDTCECECRDGYYDNNGDDVDGGDCIPKVPNDDDCNEDRECLDPNALCTNGTCQCQPCYIDYNGTCELDCIDCTCPSGQVWVNEECLSLMCENCTVNSDCLTNNSVCHNGICVCADYYYLDNCGNCVEQKHINDTCEGDNECLSGFCICDECAANADRVDACCLECDILADIVIVMDSSGSVTKTGYELEKLFVVGLINAFTISPAEVQLAIVNFAKYVVYSGGRTFDLVEHTSNSALVNAVLSFNHRRGTTGTAAALTKAKDIHAGTGGNRPGASDYVIVITDGMSNVNSANTIPAATLLKNTGALVYAVGVGNYDLTELNGIASDPDSQYVFTTPSFQTLESITTDLLNDICGNARRRRSENKYGYPSNTL